MESQQQRREFLHKILLTYLKNWYTEFMLHNLFGSTQKDIIILSISADIYQPRNTTLDKPKRLFLRAFLIPICTGRVQDCRFLKTSIKLI
jgi:hypothetical protein